MSVIGIDIGNLDCVIAQAKRGGIDIVLNENSNRKNPNMVCFQSKQRLIGEAALSVARMHFRNTATNIKLLIGRKYSNPEVQKEIEQLPFECVELPNGHVGILVSYNDNTETLSCEQILGMVLNKLDHITSMSNDGIKSSFCVLSVPGYFTDLQRRATLNASKIAGMNCLRLINEHTAIALGYGIYKSARSLFHASEPQHVMFIDMGNCAYTVSIVAFVQGKLEVKSVAYDRLLGGRNFDLAIANHVSKQFLEKFSKQKVIDPLKDPKSRMKLLAACEKAKKNLSPQGVTATNINIECLVDEYDFNGKIEIEEFENLISGLLDRLEKPILDALKDANIDKKTLADVEIVGGGTRVASVKRRLSSILELDSEKPNMGLSTTLNADEAVGRGCALQCAILSPLFKVKEFDIRDINSFPVRVTYEKLANSNAANNSNTVEDNDGDALMEDVKSSDNSVVIFTRKDDFPKTKRLTFGRNKTFEILAMYDEQDSPYLSKHTPRDIGKYVISGIPAEYMKNDTELPKIRVHLRQDINGLFGVASSQIMQEIKEEPEQMKENESNDVENKKDENTNEKTEEKPAKKRFKKIELNVESIVGGLSDKDVNDYLEYELKMALQDRVIEETANKRNELESFIYEMRNNITDKFAEFITDDEKKKFEDKLQQTEDWLYSDEGFDNTKSVYVEKLKELLQFSEPFEHRFKDHTERPSAATELTALLEDYKKKANGNDIKFNHWTDEECEKIRKHCDSTSNWLFDQMNKQGQKNKNENPILTTKIIKEKIMTVKNVCLPIINKPKPAPKVETPTNTDNSSNDNDMNNTENKKENKDDGKMDLD